MTKRYRLTFTGAELSELRRALDLITQEDANADVNMAPAEVAAKQSAARKLARAMNLPTPDEARAAFDATCERVDVTTLRDKEPR